MKKTIGIILFFVGISGIVLAGYSSLNSEKESQNVVMQFENKIKADRIKEKEGVPEPENPDKSPEQTKETAPEEKDNGTLPLDSVTGIVEIPKLDIKAPLVEGQDERLLKYGVGRVESSALPGADGNLVIGGHRNALYSSYFRHLHKLSKGDLIHVTTQKGVYTYKVTKTLTVAPKDVWVMDNTDGPTITLITCTVDRASRTIVFGEKITK